MSNSIATKTGDRGQTGLLGGTRVSKASPRVEAYGTVDELNSCLGFARSICDHPGAAELTRRVQKELFVVGAELANPEIPAGEQARVTQEMTDKLTDEVHQMEALDGILSDWSLPGDNAAAAAFDVARTVCRRAERCAVRLAEGGEPLSPLVVIYLNRLSDVIWLLARWIELDQGANSALRDSEHRGKRWSRAW